MDVRPPASTICPQSSETLNVNEGESLTLFCYFVWSGKSGHFTPYDYIWQEKSEPNPVPLNNSTVTPSSSFVKGIVVAVVGPFTADDDNTVYECSHLKPSIAGILPCSVGPVTVTPRPTDPTSQTPTQQPVTVPATLTPKRLSTKASPPSTTTTYQKTLNVTIGPAKNTPTATSTPSSVQKDITEEPINNSTQTPAVNNNTIVIILLSIVVIILAIVITILLCHKSQCKRKKRKDIKKEESEFQLRGHPASNSKQGKDEDGYLEPNPQFVNHISGRSDVGVAMATGSSSMIGLHHDYEHEIIGIKNKQDDPSYEEVNHHSWNV